MEDDKKQRRQKFRELIGKLGMDKAKDRIDWLVQNLHCSRSTARIWHMNETDRPMPTAKLEIMERLIGAAK